MAHFSVFLLFYFLAPFPLGRPPYSFIFGLVLFLAMIARCSLYLSYKNALSKDSWTPRWRPAFNIVSFSIALSWGLLFVSTLRAYGAQSTSFLIGSIVLGVGALSVENLGLDFSMLKVHFSLLLGPPILELFLQRKNPGFLAWSILFAVYFCYLVFISRRAHLFLWEALSNRELVQTQRDNLASMLEQKDRAEKEVLEARAVAYESARLAALGVMAGGIAHEINNPLQVIRALAALLRKQSISTAEAVSKIESTIDRVAKIIAGLRAFAQVGPESPFENAGLATLVTEVVDLARASQPKHRVPIEAAPISKDLTLQCRATEIGQVLINLINNSIDAVEKDENPWVRISVEEHEREVQILVEDSGNGIPENLSEMIMVPFFTTKEVGKGTGLGLSISKSIAEAHHGSLRLDRKAANTRFVLTLPKRQEAGLSSQKAF